MWARQKQSQPQGFTIVELLIVIVVIGILAAITIVAFNGVRDRSQWARVQSELASINKAIKIAFGNVIDILISGTHIIPEPALEFFTYAFLMLVITGIFIFLGKYSVKLSSI